MLALDITTIDGKYTVQMDEKGRLYALRYGEPWRDLVGDKLVLALASELEMLRERVKTIEERSRA